MRWLATLDPRLPVAVAACVAAAALAACLAPMAYAGLLALATIGAVGILVFRHTTFFCVAWLVITASTLEMTLLDCIGPQAYQSTIGAMKAVGLGLAVICALRWGWQPDPLNPAWAFALIALVGLATGLYPGLTPTDSVRSWVGSVAPFAFCFCTPPRSWSEAMLAAVRWSAIIAVAGGVVLAVLGIRPLFVDSGGWRLSGMGHPAFLAFVALTGVYACLIETFRTARTQDAALLGANLVILLLTGARAPMAYAAAVMVLSLVFVPSGALPRQTRALLILGGAAAVPALVMLAGDLSQVRIFALMNKDAAHMSGRDQLWPMFEAVAETAPWLGWGAGAGNLVIPPGSMLAKLLRTWAAHNEYLRIRVEGGWLGLGLLITLFTLWVIRHSAALPRAERGIIRLVFIAFAAHAITDNVLISTPACVLFSFTAALFARGAAEARASVPGTFALPDSGRLA